MARSLPDRIMKRPSTSYNNGTLRQRLRWWFSPSHRRCSPRSPEVTDSYPFARCPHGFVWRVFGDVEQEGYLWVPWN